MNNLSPGAGAAVNDEAARRWRRRRRRLRRRVRRVADIIGLSVFAFVVVTSLRESGGTKSSTTTTTAASATGPVGPPTADVKITSCSYRNYSATAGVTITNHTQDQQNYVVNVVFADGTQLFSFGAVTVDYLKPRERTHQLATGMSSAASAPKHLECAITGVSRFP